MGSPPTTAYGPRRQPAPTRVPACSTVPASSRVPGPTSTSSSMTTPGATSTPSCRRAPGATLAPGATRARVSSSTLPRPSTGVDERQGGLGRHLVTDQRLGGHAAEAAAEEEDLAGEAQLVAGHHTAAELGTVDGGEVAHGAAVLLALAHRQAHGGGLGERLDDHHPRHDGLVGEATHEERLVVGDVLEALEGVA